MSAVEEDTRKKCTYVFAIEDDDEDQDNEALLQNVIQSILGSEHEVLSLVKMRFCTNDSVEFQHVLKVKTNSPSYVATKFMGNDWVREDHILFKAKSPQARENWK
jgi:hypothetical protein